MSVRALTEELSTRGQGLPGLIPAGAGVLLLGTLCLLVYLWHFARKTKERLLSLDFRRRLFSRYYFGSTWGKLMEAFFGVLSMAASVLFIVETYIGATTAIVFTELIISMMFVVHWMLRMCMAASITSELTTSDSVVDYVTIVPLVLQTLAPSNDFLGTGIARIARLTRFARIFQLMRAMRVANVARNMTTNAFQNQVFGLAASIFVLIGISAGIVQYLAILEENNFTSWEAGPCPVNATAACPEQSPPRLQFHDALYYIIVTFSTVGYGDMYPLTVSTRLFFAVLAGITVYAIPKELGALGEVMALRSKYEHPLVVRANVSYVLLAAEPSWVGAKAFLQQFCHPDHCSSEEHLVVVCPAEPSVMWKELILRFQKHFTYIKGDLMNSADLERVRATRCAACYLIGDRLSPDTDLTDSRTILRVLALRERVPQLNDRTFIQLIEPENRPVLLELGVNTARIICHNELTMGLISQASLWPGFATFVSNLLMISNTSITDSTAEWQHDYSNGQAMEVYKGDIGSQYEGMFFSEVVQLVYQRQKGEPKVGSTGGGGRGHGFERGAGKGFPKGELEYEKKRSAGALLFALGNADMGVATHPGSFYRLKKGDIGFFISYNFRDVVEVCGGTVASHAERLAEASTELKRKTILQAKQYYHMLKHRQIVPLSPGQTKAKWASLRQRVVSTARRVSQMYSPSAKTVPCPGGGGAGVEEMVRYAPLITPEQIEQTRLMQKAREEKEDRVLLAQRDAAMQQLHFAIDLSEAVAEHRFLPVEVFGHIVLLCNCLDDLGSMMEMLRLGHLTPRAIVIVCDIETFCAGRGGSAWEDSCEDWSEINFHRDTYLVAGDPSSAETLLRARIADAHSVIVLSPR
jgi:voltage-gated potassium channel Kch